MINTVFLSFIMGDASLGVAKKCKGCGQIFGMLLWVSLLLYIPIYYLSFCSASLFLQRYACNVCSGDFCSRCAYPIGKTGVATLNNTVRVCDGCFVMLSKSHEGFSGPRYQAMLKKGLSGE